MTSNNREIEKKFLVDDFWKPKNKGVKIVQFYLSDTPTVRIRMADDKAFLTIKGPIKNITRPEYEYEIPYLDAVEMLSLAILEPIEKTRYAEIINDVEWTIDVFEGKNKGLVVAEIELSSEEQEVLYPLWVVKEVTKDRKYYNSNLAEHPYQTW